MWNLFKVTNLFWLMASTYFWITALISMTPILLLVNVLMIVSLGFMPIKIEIDKTTGRAFFCMLALAGWSVFINGPVMGVITILSYMPVLYLIQLPAQYKEELLWFTTKWYSIALGGGILIYFMTLVGNPPSIGRFYHPNYEPYINHVLYLETTWDYGTVPRFNAFFLEPGHQALLSSFLILANRFRFKSNPYLYVLLVGVIVSFSLAGYLLTLTGWLLLNLNSVAKVLAALAVVAGFVVAVQTWNGGDNDVNELIVRRLEYDESRGIKGNNRYFNNTDDEFAKAVKKGDFWIGVMNKANMELIGGAGIKIYILKYGVIGVFIVLLYYLSLIPPRPDVRYTVTFFLVLVLCFIQRAYPSWWSWLFPYVTGIYIARYEKYGIDR